MYKLLLPMFFLIMLTGCSGPSPQYLTRPEAISVSGPYVHQASGFSFPVIAGEFVRGSVQKYDAQGQDISVAYNLTDRSRLIAATIYVYPSPPIISIGSPPSVIQTVRSHLCNQEFNTRMQEIMAAHPNARPVDTSGQPASTAEHFSLFEYEEVFANVRQPLLSELELSCHVNDKWTVKYRITYPRDLSVEYEVQGLKRAILQGQHSS
jgi:hypothetical protein